MVLELKCLGAKFTLEWPHACMRPVVALKNLFSMKLLHANLAFVLLVRLCSVHPPFMSFPVRGLSECLTTEIAFEWPVARVLSFMRHQRLLLFKLLAAIFALVRGFSFTKV